MRAVTIALLLSATVLCPGCVIPSSVVAAPGSGAILLTGNPADVAPCRPVGSVHVSEHNLYRRDDAPIELRNQALGLGADRVLITSTDVAIIAGGVAYRCQEPAASR
jgi:hypothetical protein